MKYILLIVIFFVLIGLAGELLAEALSLVVASGLIRLLGTSKVQREYSSEDWKCY